MSTPFRSRYTRPPGRRVFTHMSVPAAIAYATMTVLTLLFRLVSAVTGLVAEVSERIADAGDSARAAARGTAIVTTSDRGGAA
jgi:hypothetical protein